MAATRLILSLFQVSDKEQVEKLATNAEKWIETSRMRNPLHAKKYYSMHILDRELSAKIREAYSFLENIC